MAFLGIATTIVRFFCQRKAKRDPTSLQLIEAKAKEPSAARSYFGNCRSGLDLMQSLGRLHLLLNSLMSPGSGIPLSALLKENLRGQLVYYSSKPSRAVSALEEKEIIGRVGYRGTVVQVLRCLPMGWQRPPAATQRFAWWHHGQ